MTDPYTYGLQLNNRHIILIWNFMIKCNIMMFNHNQICLELVAAASNGNCTYVGIAYVMRAF